MKPHKSGSNSTMAKAIPISFSFLCGVFIYFQVFFNKVKKRDINKPKPQMQVYKILTKFDMYTMCFDDFILMHSVF